MPSLSTAKWKLPIFRQRTKLVTIENTTQFLKELIEVTGSNLNTMCTIPIPSLRIVPVFGRGSSLRPILFSRVIAYSTPGPLSNETVRK